LGLVVFGPSSHYPPTSPSYCPGNDQHAELVHALLWLADRVGGVRLLRVRAGPEVELVFGDSGQGAGLEPLCLVYGHVEPAGMGEAVDPGLRVRPGVELGRVLEVVRLAVIYGDRRLELRKETNSSATDHSK
jgi:hypothetical protein